jgi:hypothetical protein
MQRSFADPATGHGCIGTAWEHFGTPRCRAVMRLPKHNRELLLSRGEEASFARGSSSTREQYEPTIFNEYMRCGNGGDVSA